MSLTTAFAIYFIIWWLALFTVLPWGVRSQHEQGTVEKGTEPGAPVLARLAMKLLWTTVVATVVFGICYVIHVNGWITLDDLGNIFGPDFSRR